MVKARGVTEIAAAVPYHPMPEERCRRQPIAHDSRWEEM
jgi:hypothetical protein